MTVSNAAGVVICMNSLHSMILNRSLLNDQGFYHLNQWSHSGKQVISANKKDRQKPRYHKDYVERLQY